MEIRTVHDFRRAIRSGPYAWPGGYPMFFLMADGEALSFSAATQERRQILEAIATHSRDEWRAIAQEINWEDGELYCAHTNQRIESAYAEPGRKAGCICTVNPATP